ncbi:Crp/Fnr family transcriptional regulator [Piscinibacter sp.]|uniref:Crp/Fnr family transcriptional regulator n=1 Tax=Piscinibacter sp. TaxID=1903157 RepID=UPI002F3F2703
MTSESPAPVVSRFIAALPRRVAARVLASCESVELAESQVLYEPGDTVRHVYFPTSSFVSLITPVHGHVGLEVGMVGNEGMLGAALALGVDTTPYRCLVQGAGLAWRMTAIALRAELAREPSLKRRINRYLCMRLAQTARSAGCTRFHVVDERLARWLLMTQDCAHSPHLHLTHEFLACMLGMRRAGITTAATALQDRQLIAYHRGEVTVLDRTGLEAAACGCYRADRESFDSLLG